MNDLNDSPRPAPVHGTALVAFAVLIAGCSSAPTATDKPAATVAPAPVLVPREGEAIRIGGDMTASVTGTDGDFRWGPCRVDTPLPAGYPKPTPPGAIELKTYPAARLAEVAGSGDPDSGMNDTFWPLFNHIKKNDIEMTSPVEMNYTGLDTEAAKQPTSWSMAFLYRTPDMNKTGTDGKVTVRDVAPITVLSIGVKGDYSMSLVEKGRESLRDFLAANPRLRIAGDWRALYYNGPAFFFWNKWAEIQVPVRAVQ